MFVILRQRSKRIVSSKGKKRDKKEASGNLTPCPTSWKELQASDISDFDEITVESVLLFT